MMAPHQNSDTSRPPSPSVRPWRLVLAAGGGDVVIGSDVAVAAAASGPTNMAVDSALLEAVKQGADPVLRLYRWSPACLSFGRNQPTRGRYDREAAARRGIDFVRRPTGGQAVLHDDELTYAVVAPVSVIGKPRAAYETINRALVTGLERLGVRTAVAGGGGPGGGGGAGVGGRGTALVPEDAESPVGQRSATVDWDAACFRRPERGEVVVDGAKLVGSAQRMEERTILQHGSILVGGSQAPAEELLVTGRRSEPRLTPGVGRGPGPSPATAAYTDVGWTTLERELGARPSPAELAAAIRAGFEEILEVGLEEGGLTPAESEAAASLEDRYRSEAWTWRR